MTSLVLKDWVCSKCYFRFRMYDCDVNDENKVFCNDCGMVLRAKTFRRYYMPRIRCQFDDEKNEDNKQNDVD